MKLFRAYTVLSCILASATASSSSSSTTCSSNDSSCTSLDYFKEAPFVPPRVLLEGNILSLEEYSSIGGSEEQTPTWSIDGCCSKKSIGELPQMSTTQSQSVLENAIRGWNNGQGTWTQMSLSDRIKHIRSFVDELMDKREEIVRVLMWEIGKNYPDAKSEFDRTISFVKKTIEVIESNAEEYNTESTFTKIGATNVFKRRNGFGIILCLGPYNYPLNETYATLIPALLMGNVVILKIPQVGGLSHLLTFDAFAKSLPPNTIHFISGSGRKTLPPLMTSGKIDGLAFIGGTNAADLLIKQHPEPHRLKIFLQLEAKNMAIILDDLCSNFDGKERGGDGGYNLSKAVDEIITGALSYNGQRCTALKMIYVPRGYGLMVSKMISDRVESMNVGLPWDTFDETNSSYSQITPLPNEGRIKFMKELMDDATAKGAQVMNTNGGSIVQPSDSHNVYSHDTLMVPAVLYPITKEMKIFKEEQFGPLIPVVEYESLDEVLQYGTEGVYGQQVSIFTKGDVEKASALVDAFSSVYGKINVNTQCGRSPDNVPFTARRSSGLGVMSIEDALREFSVPTVVAFKEGKDAYIVNTMTDVQKKSMFMANL